MFLDFKINWASSTLSSLELEQIWYKCCFNRYASTMGIFDFHENFENPLSIFGQDRISSNLQVAGKSTLYNLITRVNTLSVYKLTNVIWYSGLWFRTSSIEDKTYLEFENIPYVCPIIIRDFYKRTRAEDDPLAKQMIVLSRRHLDFLREQKFLIPKKLNDHQTYRDLEKTYLLLTDFSQ